jgi:hypothetical protein
MKYLRVKSNKKKLRFQDTPLYRLNILYLFRHTFLATHITFRVLTYPNSSPSQYSKPCSDLRHPYLFALTTYTFITKKYVIFNNGFFSSMAQQPPVGQGLLITEASRSYTVTLHSAGPLWTRDQSDAETST